MSPPPNESCSDSSLGHVPTARWQFDASVTACFDDMLARSIPQYSVMRNLCFDLGRRCVAPGTDIIDLGCSRGAALAPFVDLFSHSNRLIGIEVSEPMRAAALARFAPSIAAGTVQILETDLRYHYPDVRASLTLAVLTLQFIPLEHRQRLLWHAYQTTQPGGALIVVEKILGDGAEIDELLVDVYYDYKRANGYSQAEIDRKRYALEGVLVPLTAKANEDLLRGAGFTRVESFWRWANFAGWVARK